MGNGQRMSQEHLSYEERNRQREERIIEHERALNDSRLKARRAKPQAETPNPEQSAKALKIRRIILAVLVLFTLIALFSALRQKPAHAPAPPATAETPDN